MDFIGPLPLLNGYDMILVIIDQLIKRGIFISTFSEITALGTAKEVHNHLIAKHGFPCIIISDRGPQFASQLMKELLE